MKLPDIKESCIMAQTEKAGQIAPSQYASEFLRELITDKQECLVTVIAAAADLMHPDDKVNQLKLLSAIALVVRSINAQIEANELEEQFG